MEKTQSPPPNRDVRTPSFVPPPGSCDCHFHIIGPQALYPLHPEAPLALPDSTQDDYEAAQKVLGISRGLLVASIGHKFDYQHVLHALALGQGRYRGVVNLAPDVSDAEIAMLSRAGVVGARFFPGNAPTAELLSRVGEAGWSAHLLMNPQLQPQWSELIDGFAGNIVLEHSGLPDVTQGLDSEYFGSILRYLDSGRCWVKLSPRFSKMELAPFEDTLPFNRALVQHRSDRLLYGSDYPHPNYWAPMPNEADLLELLLLWAPDPDDRQKILVRNPEDLFGFEPAS